MNEIKKKKKKKNFLLTGKEDSAGIKPFAMKKGLKLINITTMTQVAKDTRKEMKANENDR
jgi:hypothetical protein